MSTGKNTQLTDISGYSTDRLIFSDVQECPIPGDTQGLTYKRINIGTHYPDGTTGDLIVKTPKCFSFGVSPNINSKTGAIDGYSFPLCLYSKDGKTDEEDTFVVMLEKIIESIKDHLVEDNVKEDMGKYDLIRTDLRKLNPIYRKRDKKGKILEEFGPVLYPKIISNKKSGSVLSTFYSEGETDSSGEPFEIPFEELVTTKDQKNYCHAVGAIKIESVYVGNNISLQVKLWEADVEKINNKPQRLIRSKVPVVNKPKNIIIMEDSDMKGIVDKEDEDLLSTDDESVGTGNQNNLIASSSSEDEPSTQQAVEITKKKPVRKRPSKKT
jgi:hypothetical protein